MENESSIKEQVRENYAREARRVTEGAKASCCGGAQPNYDAITSNLYADNEKCSLPAEAVAASLGCGNPTALAELKPGEVVLDLGSGGGIDVLLSARRVGPTGKAYGLDMTDEMLALARENQRKAGAQNVEFLKGDIENIPLPDNSVDVIISNCVINISADKDRVLDEAFRVLRPGGRLAVSDIVVRGEMPAEIRSRADLWVVMRFRSAGGTRIPLQIDQGGIRAGRCRTDSHLHVRRRAKSSRRKPRRGSDRREGRRQVHERLCSRTQAGSELAESNFDGHTIPNLPIRSRAAWLGEDQRIRTDWIHVLSDAEKAELDGAIAAYRRHGGSLQEVRAEQYPLPLLAPAIDSWMRELDDGRGFLLVRGFPADKYSESEAAFAYWLIGLHMGHPVPQNRNGDILGHVRDDGADPKQAGIRLYRTRVRLDFHTDGADIIGLLCLRRRRREG